MTLGECVRCIRCSAQDAYCCDCSPDGAVNDPDTFMCGSCLDKLADKSESE